jgi:hypothetical protein
MMVITESVTWRVIQINLHIHNLASMGLSHYI